MPIRYLRCLPATYCGQPKVALQIESACISCFLTVGVRLLFEQSRLRAFSSVCGYAEDVRWYRVVSALCSSSACCHSLMRLNVLRKFSASPCQKCVFFLRCYRATKDRTGPPRWGPDSRISNSQSCFRHTIMSWLDGDPLSCGH